MNEMTDKDMKWDDVYEKIIIENDISIRCVNNYYENMHEEFKADD